VITILDTNVVSEPMRPAPSSAALQWLSRIQRTGGVFVTTITVAEILFGIELLPRGKRHEQMLAQAEGIFGQEFAGRVLPFDEKAARVFPQIAAHRRTRGRPIADLDAQIAAIALSHGAALATRNTADFEDCGLRLINPWI
jgi:predicted nucleic acid-binding protein